MSANCHAPRPVSDGLLATETRSSQPVRPDGKIATSEASSFLDRHAALVFALRTFAAAMLAFSIALLLDMPRPYWAMASVYITSNQFTGATRSKAVYRILGTLIGAAGTIFLVPNLANAPEAPAYQPQEVEHRTIAA